MAELERNFSLAPLSASSLNASTTRLRVASIDPDISKIIEQSLNIINLAFIIFGTIGNIITFIILMRKNVRKHSCMSKCHLFLLLLAGLIIFVLMHLKLFLNCKIKDYLASLSLLDICCLYTWNFSSVYLMFNNKKIEHESALVCRLFSFFCYFVLQSSSWIICSIGMDRIVTIVLKSNTHK